MSTCQHCGQSIELVNYALGPEWMHNPPGNTGHKTAGGPYNVYRHCRGAVAEPTQLDGGDAHNQQEAQGA